MLSSNLNDDIELGRNYGDINILNKVRVHIYRSMEDDITALKNGLEVIAFAFFYFIKHHILHFEPLQN